MPLEKPQVEFGGGVIGRGKGCSWKINCKIALVIISVFCRLTSRLRSQRTARCSAKAGNWHYVRREKRPKLQRLHLQGWLGSSPPLSFPRGFTGPWASALAPAPVRHFKISGKGAGTVWRALKNCSPGYTEPSPGSNVTLPDEHFGKTTKSF